MYRMILALAVLVGPAVAQAPENLVRGLCQKTGCDEFEVVAAQRVRESPLGVLMRTQIKTFVADNRGRRPVGDEQGYVFCSYVRPTIIAESKGQYVAFEIAPFAIVSTQQLRQQTNFVAMYFTVCHGPETGREAVRDLVSTADELGYSSDLQRSITRSITEPDDVLR